MATSASPANLTDRKRKLLSVILLSLADDDVETAAITVVQSTTAVLSKVIAEELSESETDENDRDEEDHSELQVEPENKNKKAKKRKLPKPPKVKKKRSRRIERPAGYTPRLFSISKRPKPQTAQPKPKPRKRDDEVTKRLYSDLQFQDFFKMDRTTFEKLCELVAPHLPTRTMSTEKKVMATLWVLTTRESFRQIAERFEVNKGGLFRIVKNVCQALTDLRSDFIRWPAQEELPSYARDFEFRYGISGVVGVIEGAHILIPEPKDHFRSYKNRKGKSSMQLQVVCNASLLFLDVVTGWPGSVSNSRVLRNSPLLDLLDDGALPPEYHLLGDSSYPLTPYLLVPFDTTRHLQPMETKFNRKHSAAMMEVKRAIGLLKGKFRRLKYLDRTKVTSIPHLIFAACVLHNFIILEHGVDEEDIDLSDKPVAVRRGSDHAYARTKSRKALEDGMGLDMEVDEVVDSMESSSDSDGFEEDDHVVWTHDYVETAAEKRSQIAQKLNKTQR